MKHAFAIFSFFLLLIAGCTDEPQPDDQTGNGGNSGTENLVPQEVTLHDAFAEEFSDEASEYFDFSYRTNRDDFRYYPGVRSFSEKNVDILMLRIDPSDQAGSERGCNIYSKDYTFYGTYSARVHVPDIREVQPDVAAIAGFSVYNEDPSYGYGEISFEWRLADPRIIYMRTLTGVEPEQNKVKKTVNLADGTVYDASCSSETVQKNGTSVINFERDLSGTQNGPETFSPLTGFDATDRFYIYGFDWYPDRIIWWVQFSKIDRKIILWEYEGSDIFPGSPSPSGIPVIPSRCRLNFWHSKISPAEGLPGSVEAPLYPYELEVDWISYEPFEDLNNAWREEHFK